MAILYDARGNELLGTTDQVVGGVITDSRPQTASLGVVNAEGILDLSGQARVQFDLRSAAFVGTVVFEGTVDGTNYWSLVGYDPQAQAHVASVVGAGAVVTSIYVGVAGFKRVRVRCSAYTSGALTVAARATPASFIMTAVPLPSVLCVTGTAAVNTGVTVTLPAVAGLYHYVTMLQMVKFYSVVGVAAAAPVLITTTNLPGNPAFTFDQPATPQGQASIQQLQFSNPMKSSVLNTATTFVAPVQLQTIWRINVWYYVGA